MSTDWSQLLHDNHEAQDLLSTAIAHHHQYRDDDPLKRKGIALPPADDSSDDVHAPGDGKPAPKKAGRKPLTTEPTNKRKAQNRAAQRAFRDRKEKYVKSLEDRIKELEEMNPGQSDSKLAEENMNLKVLVQKLETENYYLKEQSFTFDFPITQPGLYNVAKASRDNLLNSPNSTSASDLSPASQTVDSPSSKSSSLSPNANVTKPATHDQLPWSPPSSVGDSVPNSPLDRDRLTPEHEGVTQTPHAESPGVVPSKLRNTSPRDIALLSSLADGAAKSASAKDSFAAYTNSLGQLNQPTTSFNNTTIASTSPMSTLANLSEHTPSPNLNDLINAPMFSTDATFPLTTAASGLPISPLMFDPTHALFTDFRDPSDPHDFLASLEDPVDVTAFSDNPIIMGDLFSDTLLDYSTTTSMLPNITAVAPLPGQDQVPVVPKDGHNMKFEHRLPPLGEDEKALPCPQAWEHLAKHPNFDDADIDELCTDMKSKAKCSGHGPVIPLTDINNLMTRLDNE